MIYIVDFERVDTGEVLQSELCDTASNALAVASTPVIGHDEDGRYWLRVGLVGVWQNVSGEVSRKTVWNLLQPEGESALETCEIVVSIQKVNFDGA